MRCARCTLIINWLLIKTEQNGTRRETRARSPEVGVSCFEQQTKLLWYYSYQKNTTNEMQRFRYESKRQIDSHNVCWCLLLNEKWYNFPASFFPSCFVLFSLDRGVNRCTRCRCNVYHSVCVDGVMADTKPSSIVLHYGMLLLILSLVFFQFDSFVR